MEVTFSVSAPNKLGNKCSLRTWMDAVWKIAVLWLCYFGTAIFDIFCHFEGVVKPPALSTEGSEVGPLVKVPKLRHRDGLQASPCSRVQHPTVSDAPAPCPMNPKPQYLSPAILHCTAQAPARVNIGMAFPGRQMDLSATYVPELFKGVKTSISWNACILEHTVLGTTLCLYLELALELPCRYDVAALNPRNQRTACKCHPTSKPCTLNSKPGLNTWSRSVGLSVEVALSSRPRTSDVFVLKVPFDTSGVCCSSTLGILLGRGASNPP